MTGRSDKFNSTIENDFDDFNNEDVVNHPSHYSWLKDAVGVEVIDIAELLPFNKGCAIKYILRSGKKNIGLNSEKEVIQKEIEDLKKAEFFCRQEVKRISKLYFNNNEANTKHDALTNPGILPGRSVQTN